MAKETRRGRMTAVRRVVVKLGTTTVTGDDNQLAMPVLRRLVKDVVALRERGLEVAIVSSGAVAAGMGRLGVAQRPRAIADLQAVAAVGQNLLMHAYESLFHRYGVPVGQVLLTAEDMLEDRQRYLNLSNTFRRLYSLGAVPVVNENDSVAVTELKRTIGDNDMLAAYVSNLVRAGLLIMLSDVEGLYPSFKDGPRGEVIREVHRHDGGLEAAVSKSLNRLSRGGMATKIRAARLMMACGEMSIIAHGGQHRLVDILDGKEIGTLFVPWQKRLRSRKRWIGFASPCSGTVVVDRGAEGAIIGGGKSLLSTGVVACRGEFGIGDVVRVENSQQVEVARGLSRYTSDEVERILGQSSSEAEMTLGRPAPEVIHRDDLVLL